ncbi:MAG: hypothetical protein LBH70_08940 [Spirochaetaceae bacterium]|jgi:hypothetical protein|nr:hypothetical protein [Spirochaetaceae bacterium]
MDKSGKQQNHCVVGIKFLKNLMYFVIVLSLFLLSACGIEDYPYLEPVEESNITWELNVQATILLPPSITSLQFTHFAIYYRIYISGESILSNILPSDMSKINPALYQNYAAFLPYTRTDTTSGSTQIGTLISNQKYYPLYTETLDLKDVLSRSAIGQRVVIDFRQTTTGRRPTLEIGGREYVLWRTTGKESQGENFDIKPDGDRSFVNTAELNSSQYADSKNITANNDVADNTISGDRYTYVSMYIVSTGYDTNYNPIFSQPAHIGVFRLPEP